MKPSEIQHIDTLCATGKKPIRINDPHPFTPQCKPMGESWHQSLEKSNKWWHSRNRAIPLQVDPDLLKLREALRKMGGEESCLPAYDEDLQKILTRGQLWSGKNLQKARGKNCKCHENSSLLWEANQDKLFLATGYALSNDGMWRQHTWCVLPKPRSVQIVETTEPRELYFGFVMTLEETLLFGELNTDFGLELKPETGARYWGEKKPSKEVVQEDLSTPSPSV